MEKRGVKIGIDQIRAHFGCAISDAASALGVGLTVFKKRCRELGIIRWPYRQVKSLDQMILSLVPMQEHEHVQARLSLFPLFKQQRVSASPYRVRRCVAGNNC